MARMSAELLTAMRRPSAPHASASAIGACIEGMRVERHSRWGCEHAEGSAQLPPSKDLAGDEVKSSDSCKTTEQFLMMMSRACLRSAQQAIERGCQASTSGLPVHMDPL